MDAARRAVPAEWIRGPSDRLAIEAGCYFDPEPGRRAIAFLERFCRQSKGRWAGKPLQLLEWQRDLLMRLFGWRRADGTRRYRRCYVEIPKKNGKSTMVSGLVLLLMLADGEGAPEVYINACDRAQASIVFDEAARMVKASPELARRLTLVDSKKTIVDPVGNGRLMACSKETAAKDGLNPSAVVFDELHRQPNRELWEVFEYAGASREQPLTISITTAGEGEDGVWFEQRQYSEQVNAGVIPDWSHLGVVYRADPAADLDDPRTWRRANPSLGVTIKEEDFARELAEAKRSPETLANFKRLRLGIVTGGASAWVDLARWDACDAAPGAVRGPLYAGADLSATTDLTATAVLAGDELNGFDLEMRFYLPEDNIGALEQRDGKPYRAWAEAGFITLTPGEVVDYAFIRADLVDLAGRGELRSLQLDKWNATQLATQLAEEDGLPVQFVTQGFISLNEPTKTLEKWILGRKLRHGGHPVLRWNAANAVAQKDPAGNVKLSKSKSRQKIDGLAALVNAVAGYLAAGAEAGGSVYDRRGVIVL